MIEFSQIFSSCNGYFLNFCLITLGTGAVFTLKLWIGCSEFHELWSSKYIQDCSSVTLLPLFTRVWWLYCSSLFLIMALTRRDKYARLRKRSQCLKYGAGAFFWLRSPSTKNRKKNLSKIRKNPPKIRKKNPLKIGKNPPKIRKKWN